MLRSSHSPLLFRTFLLLGEFLWLASQLDCVASLQAGLVHDFVKESVMRHFNANLRTTCFSKRVQPPVIYRPVAVEELSEFLNLSPSTWKPSTP